MNMMDWEIMFETTVTLSFCPLRLELEPSPRKGMDDSTQLQLIASDNRLFKPCAF